MIIEESQHLQVGSRWRDIGGYTEVLVTSLDRAGDFLVVFYKRLGNLKESRMPSSLFLMLFTPVLRAPISSVEKSLVRRG